MEEVMITPPVALFCSTSQAPVASTRDCSKSRSTRVTELRPPPTSETRCWFLRWSWFTRLQEACMRRRMPSAVSTSMFWRLVSAMPLRRAAVEEAWRTASRVRRSLSRVRQTSRMAPARATRPISTWKAKQMPR